jgi:hypothetical protein
VGGSAIVRLTNEGADAVIVSQNISRVEND